MRGGGAKGGMEKVRSFVTFLYGNLPLQVFVVDNYFTGRKRNIEQWLGHENFEMLHHDIVNPLFIEVWITRVVFH